MNILLIYPPVSNQAVYSKDFRRVKGTETSAYPPLGLMYLQGLIKRETGHKIKLLDLTLPSRNNFNLETFIKNFDPDLVGMTAYTLCFFDLLQTARRVKSASPEVKLVVGGPHIDLYPEETMLHPEIDFAIIGDGEYPFLELTKTLERKDNDFSGVPSLYWRGPNGRVIVNNRLRTEKDLNHLPFPCRNDVEQEAYFNPFFSDQKFANISTSRGCPFNCTFCDVTDKHFRARSINNIIAEIEQLITDYSIYNFFIVDDLFNINTRRVSEFCRNVIKKRLKIKWIFRGRIDQISDDMLDECAEAGCIHIIFGIEDSTDKGLRLIRKNITIDQTIKVFDRVRLRGIKTTANFIIGFPHHRSKEDILKINELLKNLRPDYLQLGILIPFPGSYIFKNGVERGIIDEEKWTGYIKRPAPVFEMPLWDEHLELDDLTSLYEKIMKNFYLSPKQIFRRLLEIRSWHQLTTYIKVGMATIKVGHKKSAIRQKGVLVR